MPTVINGTTGITTDAINATSGNTSLTTLNVASNAISAVNSLGFRNRIINGDMSIDQRNNGAPVNTDGAFPVDRWWQSMIGGGVISAQRSTIVPAGFTNSLGMTVTTADSSIAASDGYFLTHNIEGFNVADLGWGTASAQAVTVSFQVRSSITGTYAVAFGNSAFNRLYVATYTVNSANTYETKTVTIPGDTSGTWLTNNGIGLRVYFDLGSGSAYNASSSGAWLGTGVGIRLSSTVNWISTSGATFYITGVQLEAGTVATPFERLPYGTELMLCQRYCYVVKGQGNFSVLAALYMPTSLIARASLSLPVNMRSAPTAVFSAANTFLVQQGGAVNLTPSAVQATAQSANTTIFNVDLTVSGGSTGTAGAVYDNGTANAQITLSSEL